MTNSVVRAMASTGLYPAFSFMAVFAAMATGACAAEKPAPLPFKVQYALLLDDGPKFIAEVACKSGEDCRIYGSEGDEMTITLRADGGRTFNGNIRIHCQKMDCSLGYGESSRPYSGERQSFFVMHGKASSGLELRYARTLGRLFVKCQLPEAWKQQARDPI